MEPPPDQNPDEPYPILLSIRRVSEGPYVKYRSQNDWMNKVKRWIWTWLFSVLRNTLSPTAGDTLVCKTVDCHFACGFLMTITFTNLIFVFPPDRFLCASYCYSPFCMSAFAIYSYLIQEPSIPTTSKENHDIHGFCTMLSNPTKEDPRDFQSY